MKNAVPYSIALVTLLMCPTWLSHLFADDGGLITLGGGMLTEADIFGAPGSFSTKKIPPMHPIVFHVCAVCGLFAFALCFIAIAATYYGDAKVKKVVCAIYGAWLLCIFAVQYTHPWTGSAPESIFQMPAPIVYMMVLVVGTGVALDDDVKLKLK
ncbi:hypothetical protein JL720_1371 [Aureococcus anophagefferens]|nr:hypothetical protein JL720_1371 [Aureococcus anophagefferens]